ncbi:hypothetical protein M409DRAFT_54818 [Zasmidium cellare ATCC 36951]|uniref:Nitronate monooxygenase domain-containing protein n=1 Tax=Zasmidium cellare ATCC 36951 TaxID=1080233 RepID=A0A6A6CH45_ZASCE|nr:uncharacterized protein M409DRAFT_54818 [Zasmidium cellare ATCC 36951]KAF2166475.1 hypothetical protein M409DRAFT_54818 [Zasmidium cellare ATCC 36951]
MASLKAAYPWIKLPLVASAPMLGASTPRLAAAVTNAGGVGFLPGGSNAGTLDRLLQEVKTILGSTSGTGLQSRPGILPIGVGFQLFNSTQSLDSIAAVIKKYVPAVVWLFAPKENVDLQQWSKRIRSETENKTHIWIQVANQAEAMESIKLANPDLLILQGADAGGHGRRQAASLISLVPEVLDSLQEAGKEDIFVLAAGGIVEPRAAAAALALGASGIVMGTRFLVAEEAGIAQGWKQALLRTKDGGVATVRSTLCDRIKETRPEWPVEYDGRQLRNKGHDDEDAGMPEMENIKRYKEEMKKASDVNAWENDGRMVAYSGTGVGLIKNIQPAASIVEEILRGVRPVLERSATALEHEGKQSNL